MLKCSTAAHPKNKRDSAACLSKSTALRKNPPGVVVEGADARALVCVPQAHSLVVAARDDQITCRTEASRAHPIAVATERELKFLPRDAPHFDGLVVGGGEERCGVGRKGYTSHTTRVRLDDAGSPLADVWRPQAHCSVLRARCNDAPCRRDGHGQNWALHTRLQVTVMPRDSKRALTSGAAAVLRTRGRTR